jgi:hypothetical protein
MNNKRPATRTKLSVLAQVCKLIPGHLVPKLAGQYGIDKQARKFTPWSHLVALLHAQLTHAIGLNDVCDGLRHHGGLLGAIRGAVAPARNTLSHANRTRDPAMMEALFWKVLDHLGNQTAHFGLAYKGIPRRFKRAIYAIDSSTIALVANCMPWAKHRRRKAAAKCHLRLDLQSFLPACAIVEEASHHDDSRARELCAGLKDGEVALFDKAYVNFGHLFDLDQRGVFWVTRAKDNMNYHVCRKLQRKPGGKVLRDDLITLKTPKSKAQYPRRLRRVVMRVEVDGKEIEMVFITNNLDWAATSVGELYQARWGIEVFFKQIKQTLKVCDFLGHSKSAIRWQVWSALLLYVLLRYLAHTSGWHHSFIRLFTVIRGVIWDRIDLMALLRFYGTARTASGVFRMRAAPEAAYLPGLEPVTYGTATG